MKIPKNIDDLSTDLCSAVASIDSMFDEVFLVGGAVRDSILGVESHDIDFAVPLKADEVYEILSKSSLFKVRDEAMRYGTIGASIGTFDVQITSYRAERYIRGSRKPLVSGAVDIDSDLSRRDFTINAIALSRNELVDPYDGVRDIKEKVIRTVGIPERKFQEDPIRILRAFRFVSTLGFNIETKTLEAAQLQRDSITIVSKERVGMELQKIMTGKYWADALNEMTEIGVTNIVLNRLNIPYRVGPGDIMYEFERYSTDKLEEMPLANRWMYLIRAISYAAKSSGVVSVSQNSIAAALAGAAQLSKALKRQISDVVESPEGVTSGPTKASEDKERLSAMKLNYQKLKAAGDKRWMIEAAKYFTQRGRQEIQAGNFTSAEKYLRKAVSITEENYDFVISWQDKEKKARVLREMKSYYISRLRYLFIAIILASKLRQKCDTLDALRKQAKKTIPCKYIKECDLDAALDRAIVHVYKMNPRYMDVEQFDTFLKSSVSFSEEDRVRMLREYISEKLRDKSLAAKDRMLLYKAKMDIARESLKPGKTLGLEYYDPYVDYMYNRMISTSDLKQFGSLFDEFLEETKTYKELMDSQGSSIEGERNIYLTAASSHIAALSLAKALDDRIALTQEAVKYYKLAGSRLNSSRYTVLLDWFLFAKYLLDIEFSEDVDQLLLGRLKTARRSLSYVDGDEEFLKSQRSIVVEKRDMLKDALSFVGSLMGSIVIDVPVKSSDVTALQTLLASNTIDKSDAFKLYKNIISKAENQRIEYSPLDQEDREMERRRNNELAELLTGESETMEYKSSWRFDVNRYRKTKQKEKSEEVTKSVIKNIAGFMNKRGGIILLGVDDDISVVGLESTDLLLDSNRDPRKGLDNLQLHMREDIESALGQEVYNRLQFDMLKYGKGCTVIKITVPETPLDQPCLYKDKNGNESYYVRTGTTCEKSSIKLAFARISSQ